MRKPWWLGLVVGCAVVIAACGSKDPDDGDNGEAGEGGGRGGKGGSAGKGGTSADAGPGIDGGSGSGGSGDPDGGEPAECEHDAYLPMAVGNSWTYRVINPVDGESTKVNTIDREEEVGGTGPNADLLAFHALTTKTSGAGMDMTESWQGVLDDGSVVRYREISYRAGSMVANGEEHWDPYKLRIDNSPEHIEADATWNETYEETKIDNGVPISAQRNDGWTIDDVDVPCGPVKGRMLSCIKVSKSADGADTGKTYWYARCVGKVREMGTQVEELTDYELH
jgi:hypothetical protein